MEIKDVYKHAKKGAINIKNTRRMDNQSTDAKKSLFYENVLYLTSFSQDLGLFVLFFYLLIYFHQDFFIVILFPETLLAALKLF